MKSGTGSLVKRFCLILLSAGLICGLTGLPFAGVETVAPAAATQPQTHYIVKSGDSLWTIARRLGTSVAALKRANNLRSDLIFPNQVLVIPVTAVSAPAAPAAAASPAEAQNDAAEKIPPINEYTVQAGDTLWSIAQKLGVDPGALKRANNVQNDFLEIGQALIIPEPGAGTPASHRVPNPMPSRSGDRMQIILDYARTLEGHPYRWGGNSPGGFDCSGFVYHVFEHHGISLPRTSYAMFGVGTPVSRSELCPGDLVFFTTYRAGASHVGIFYGNEMFLHGSSAGGAVIWTSLDTPYYSARFLGGRRVLP